MDVLVIGAGLAGSEAAWQIAESGHRVEVVEMRPEKMTKAHKTGLCAELVCSNSFRGAALNNAVGLFKEELKIYGSLIMEAALVAEVPAGGALAVDRDVFSQYVTDKLTSHSNISFRSEEICEVPEASRERPVIIATGPLTGNRLAEALEQLIGSGNLAFFDAISPIFHTDSIDRSKIFRQSRYDKGGDDYLNVPLDEQQYQRFIEDVGNAEKYTGNEDVEHDSLEKLRPFEGCMPIEDMIERGPDTLRFGPFKPVGLTDPNTGRRPHAVMQLRQDDRGGTLWSLVGMQTRMKRAAQERIFRALPGLERAEFVRYGSVHRNTFIDSPKCLYPTLEFRERPGLLFAGQITGTEGYVESTGGGLVAGINASRMLKGEEPIAFPAETAIGSLTTYISEPTRADFQPMNISFGLMESYMAEPKRDKSGKKVSKKDRRLKVAERALVIARTLSEKLESSL